MKRAKRLKTKGIYFLYRTLQAFGLPVLILYLFTRGLRNRDYWRSLPQRFGLLPRSFKQTTGGAIWLHAVSVGEILACQELLRRLRQEFPRTALFVSTSTVAGRKIAGEKLKETADGVFYAPLDYVFAVRRVLRLLRPSVVVVAETEIWPNLFRETKRIGAALVMINGRISDRAFPRYRRWQSFFRLVMPQADAILVQTDAIRERFLELGAPPERTRTAGNIKYDFEARAAEAPYITAAKPGKVWIAASTMPPALAGDPDEDDVVIAAFQELAQRHRDLLLILAPRKPERFDVVAQKLEAAGVGYTRRTYVRHLGPLPHVLLLDTIGELGGMFGFADVVFMGGTLASRGGHNLLEPALFGKPVIAGPHMENFQEIADSFRAAGAYLEIEQPGRLAAVVESLLSDPVRAEAIGSRARASAEARRGATARAIDEIRALHATHLPRFRPAMPFLLRWTLSKIWIAGGRRRLARYLRAQRRIDAPVISVGNLTMGGTGKTPCVLRLADLLNEAGYRPGILSRGYRRSSPEPHIILAPCEEVRPELTGDEPQIFIRSGLAPVGIGADRYVTGMLLRQQFGVNVLLLDDGYQHLKVARDLDILLIDALNPFGGGGVFPLGRLREPLDAMARADLILITRADLSDTVPAIEHTIRQWNARAPVLRAWTTPVAWVENRTGRRFAIGEQPFDRVGGFCGLGNPAGFLRTLQGMDIKLADWYEYSDHHRYRPKELRRLSEQAQWHGAHALVTTEKDAVNLCEMGDDLLAPLPLYWLQIGMFIEPESELKAALGRILV